MMSMTIKHFRYILCLWLMLAGLVVTLQAQEDPPELPPEDPPEEIQITPGLVTEVQLIQQMISDASQNTLFFNKKCVSGSASGKINTLEEWNQRFPGSTLTCGSNGKVSGAWNDSNGVIVMFRQGEV
ncbi:MAG: hypothetical protein HQM12_24165, partial [SAR324 cluster bacterium]|nr:hypothetical protein [SAR324 cluster bacterium]